MLAGIAQTGANPTASAVSMQRVIETRQDGFNTIGWATKAINDQLKTRSPDLQKIAQAAATIDKWAPEVAGWFPAGSGRESGYKTDALPEIWTDRANFDALARRLVTESQRLKEVVATNDPGAIKVQFTALREVCSRCHRGYLAD